MAARKYGTLHTYFVMGYGRKILFTASVSNFTNEPCLSLQSVLDIGREGWHALADELRTTSTTP